MRRKDRTDFIMGVFLHAEQQDCQDKRRKGESLQDASKPNTLISHICLALRNMLDACGASSWMRSH